jgi:hypothetical protein
MNLDLPHNIYLMVKSKLYFVDFDHTILIGGTNRYDQLDQTCQFWVRIVISATVDINTCNQKDDSSQGEN